MGEEVQLDLDFEEKEVFDVMGLDINFLYNIGDVTADDEANVTLALTSDPDKATTTLIQTEAIFQDDDSFIHYAFSKKHLQFEDATGISLFTQADNYQYVFLQPYTVARNVKWILAGTFGAAFVVSTLGPAVAVTLWGRRRNAQEAEFMNIVYRERF